MRQTQPQTSFAGGISSATKTGPENSAAFLRNVDIRSDPSETRVLPRATKDSATITVPASSTVIFNPDAGTGSGNVTVDGFIQIAGGTGGGDSSRTWAEIRDALGTDVDLMARPINADDNIAFIRATTTTNEFDYLTRGIFLFDTSSLPDGITITSAALELYVSAKNDTLGAGQSVVVVGSTPATNTNLVVADYTQLGTTAYSGATTIASITAGTYNSIALNATGISNISLTGVTRLGVRIEADRANIAPSWASAGNASIIGNYADGSSKPRFSVTYTGGGTSETNTRGLVKWIVSGSPNSVDTYFYDETGTIYTRTSAGVWSLSRSVSSSTGQGMGLFSDYLYYVQNTQLGRYGPLSTGASFTDNFQVGLDTTSDYAPVIQFLDFLAVCHGNKIARVYGTETSGGTIPAAAVTLPTGYKIRCACLHNEFLVVGAWRGSAITSAESGKLFFWDGTASTYNFYVDVPEGGVNAVWSHDGVLFYVAGSNGAVLGWENGPLGRLFGLPKLAVGSTVEIYPGAISSWRSLLHLGVAGSTTSTTLEQGVYSYGTRDPRVFPAALSCDYTVSTGTESGAGLRIGAVKGIGTLLYFSWRDGTQYAVDSVTAGGSAATSATIELLRFDNGKPHKKKQALDFVIGHTALVSGESIQLKRAINRATSYTTQASNSTVDTTDTRYGINAEFREIDLAVDIATTGTTAPTVLGSIFEHDDAEEEQKA